MTRDQGQTLAANVFTHPEIATVGIGYQAIASGTVPARTVTLPLATNARAKMQGFQDGFVKVLTKLDHFQGRFLVGPVLERHAGSDGVVASVIHVDTGQHRQPSAGFFPCDGHAPPRDRDQRLTVFLTPWAVLAVRGSHPLAEVG